MQVSVAFENEKCGNTKHTSLYSGRDCLNRKQGSVVLEAPKPAWVTSGSTADGAARVQLLGLYGCSCTDSGFEALSYGSS